MKVRHAGAQVLENNDKEDDGFEVIEIATFCRLKSFARSAVAEQIKMSNPDWKPGVYICLNDLN